MVRSGFCIYLAFMMLAGPWLCCCTTVRAVAESKSAEAGAPAYRANLPACCQHHAANSTPQPSRQQQPGRHDCPCGHDYGRSATALDSESARQLQPPPEALSTTDVPALATFELLPVDCTPPVIAEHQAPPFLTASDFLHVFHLLRC